VEEADAAWSRSAGAGEFAGRDVSNDDRFLSGADLIFNVSGGTKPGREGGTSERTREKVDIRFFIENRANSA